MSQVYSLLFFTALATVQIEHSVWFYCLLLLTLFGSISRQTLLFDFSSWMDARNAGRGSVYSIQSWQPLKSQLSLKEDGTCQLCWQILRCIVGPRHWKTTGLFLHIPVVHWIYRHWDIYWVQLVEHIPLSRWTLWKIVPSSKALPAKAFSEVKVLAIVGVMSPTVALVAANSVPVQTSVLVG